MSVACQAPHSIIGLLRLSSIIWCVMGSFSGVVIVLGFIGAGALMSSPLEAGYASRHGGAHLLNWHEYIPPREDDHETSHHSQSDQDAALAALERGEIKPIAMLIRLIRDRLPGDILGIEIERRYDRWAYEFRVILKDGHLMDLYVDANSGEVIGQE